jgi:hypothetical protein
VPRHGERELVPAFVVGVFAHELLDRPEVALDAVEVAGVGRRGTSSTFDLSAQSRTVGVLSITT